MGTFQQGWAQVVGKVKGRAARAVIVVERQRTIQRPQTPIFVE